MSWRGEANGGGKGWAQLESLKATTDGKEVTFKISYGLPLEEMLRWGLFVSQPRSIRETDQPFPEPGDWGPAGHHAGLLCAIRCGVAVQLPKHNCVVQLAAQHGGVHAVALLKG